MTRRWLAVFCLTGTSLAGCREPLRKLGSGQANASLARAEQMFAALGARVADPYRNRKFDTARVKIANAAFLPSRVWDDTSVWTSTTASRRTLLIAGRFAGGRYHLEAARTAPPPQQPAESRHLINLTRLSDAEFAWDTEVPFAIGSITAREIGAFVGALFSSAEGRAEPDVRADYRAAVPQTSAVLGQLFRVDSIRTTHLPDRSTLATFGVTMTPAGVEAKYPNYARYLRRYALTTKMHWTLSDKAGGSFFEALAADGHLLLRVRTLGGSMVPLSGAARPMPDLLTLNGAFTMKVRRFTVGFHDYHTDFSIVRTDDERSLGIVSRSEPEWVLPFVTERLLRTPLRRPFQGRGMQFRIGVWDSVGAQTVLNRRMHFEVRESAILRFIGKLGAIAVGDYQGKAEREQLAWLREAFEALVADIRSLGP